MYLFSTTSLSDIRSVLSRNSLRIRCYLIYSLQIFTDPGTAAELLTKSSSTLAEWTNPNHSNILIACLITFHIIPCDSFLVVNKGCLSIFNYYSSIYAIVLGVIWFSPPSYYAFPLNLGELDLFYSYCLSCCWTGTADVGTYYFFPFAPTFYYATISLLSIISLFSSSSNKSGN